ncbi:MAG: ATP-binding protein [Chloroflexaceae bacterium]
MKLLARISLQRKLVVAFVAVLLIPTLILSVYHLVEIRALLLERTSLEFQHRAELRAEIAGELVEHAVRDLLAVARLPSLRRHLHSIADTNDPLVTDLSEFLSHASNPSQALCVFAVAADEQLCVRASGAESVWLPRVEPVGASVARAARQALAAAGQSGARRVIIAPSPASSPGDQRLSLITLVVRDRGEPVAVTLELPVQELFGPLIALEAGVSTSIVDATGTYLFRSEAGQLGLSEASTLLESHPRDGPRILEQVSGALIASEDRPQALQVFARVQPADQRMPGWTVIYTVPLSAVTGQIWRSEVMIVTITASALLLALLVTMRLAHDIVRPVRALAAAAERVGNGDLHAPIPVAGTDEIGALARTFEGTVARLREAIAATESRRQEAETLRAATQALSSTLDLNQVLDLILSELRKVVPYDSASVQVVRDGMAEIIGAYGLQRGEQAIGFRFALTPGLTPNAEVAATRKPVILDDAPATYPHFNSEPFIVDPIRSWLGVPLLFGERLIGMLTLDKHQVGFFSGEHARLAAAFAAQAAIALENARLYEEARRELAERQRIEAEQRHLQKMEALGRLAGGIAHDFNNLLTVILGEVSLILDDLPADDPRRHGLEQILRSGGRAADLTRQLLAFSRRQMLQPELLNLNQVLTGMEQMLRRLIGEDVALTLLLFNNLPPVLADRGQIEQVVMNLVVNARDAMPHGGHLVIQTAMYHVDAACVPPSADAQPGSYAVLTVSDTGSGIDPAVQPHIFEPFFTTKPRDKGTGLGLAMVHGIVQQSGGFIRFASRLNHGTTFEIYLPTQPAAPPATTISASRPIALPDSCGTVLLVEDEAPVRLLVSQILLRAGFTVLEAGDGYHALKLAEQYTAPIDLLLTDIVMPNGLNGVQLASAIRTRRPAIAVIYMSGYPDDARIEHHRLNHGEQFIQKPFTPEKLLHTLTEALSTRVASVDRAKRCGHA